MLALSLLEMQQQRIAEAANWAGKALVLLPSLPEAHFYNAAASLALGNDAVAEKSARLVVAGPDAQRYPRAYFILGNVLARKGEIVKKQLAEWQSGGKLP
jgi:hypothetical protein